MSNLNTLCSSNFEIISSQAEAKDSVIFLNMTNSFDMIDMLYDEQ